MASKPIAIEKIETLEQRRSYHQGYFQYVSPTECRLIRDRGKWVTIDNIPQEIPEAGVPITPAGSTEGTAYYVYTYMSPGVMTLMYSATVPVLDSRSGMMVMTGDATKTLVGMFCPATGPIFQDDDGADSGTGLCVISYYNRKEKTAQFKETSTFTTASPSYTPFGTTIKFLTWGDETAHFVAESTPLCTASGYWANLQLFIDSTGASVERSVFGSVANQGVFIAARYNRKLSAGLHTVTGKVKTSGATFSFYAGFTEVTVRG